MRQRVIALLRQAAQRSWNTTALDTSASQRHFASKGTAAAAAAATRHVMLHGPPQHVATAAEAAATSRRNALTAATLLAAAGGAYYTAVVRRSDTDDAEPRPPTDQHLVNWSGTHECHVQRFHQPESLAELEAVVRRAHAAGEKLRCVGSALSPNGLAFEEKGMVSLALLDRLLEVDKASGRVRVQGGMRVQDLTEALRPHGLTLQNFASIREQTVGGLTQVSAHGSGAAIPPIDAGVVGIKLVTPALGTLDLTEERDPELLHLARVGLGCLGVVAEVTLQCVPAHRLQETTFVATRAQVRRNHSAWLGAHKHLRYMWIPSTDAVVVVQCDEVAPGGEAAAEAAAAAEPRDADAAAPMRALLAAAPGGASMPLEESAGLSPTQCRDALLAAAPLDPAWVAKVNAAEAEFWRRSAGTRVGWSDELLGFDCGGEQWVHEVCLPTGTRARPSGADLDYMDALLKAVQRRKVPAPAPIEQRWSAGSASPMSPSHGPPDSLFSWVGIIMYLPEEAAPRRLVTEAFGRYRRVVESELMGRYHTVEHWAKIEAPGDGAELAAARARLAAKYPLQRFLEERRRLDPKNVLGNRLVDELLGSPVATSAAGGTATAAA